MGKLNDLVQIISLSDIEPDHPSKVLLSWNSRLKSWISEGYQLSNVQNPSLIPLYWLVFVGILLLGHYNPQYIGLYNPRTNHQPTEVLNTAQQDLGCLPCQEILRYTLTDLDCRAVSSSPSSPWRSQGKRQVKFSSIQFNVISI